MLRLLGERSGDQRLIRLIGKWLRMGAMEDGQRVDTGKGTPQGSVISPVLANSTCSTYSICGSGGSGDRRKRAAQGSSCDTPTSTCGLAAQGGRGTVPEGAAGKARPVRTGTAPGQDPPDRVRTVRDRDRKTRGQGRPETFDFLGMTQYCRQTRKGRCGLGRKPVAKRRSRTLKAIRAKLRRRMHAEQGETGKWLGRVLRGWYNYFAVPTSHPYLRRFERRVRKEWMAILRRRSQKDRHPWKRLHLLCDELWPPVRVLHPWPDRRFAVTHRR